MENKRNIRLVINFIIMGTLLVLPLFSFAYADKTTHPALTNEIVKFFNIHYSDLKLDDKEKELIVQGSIDEDAFGRWMQHYYDPVYNRGLILLKKWQSSKEWAKDTKAQAGFMNRPFAGSIRAFYTSEDDYSWDRAVYEYVWGDKERGLSTLGHILHLIEDATVPPHTRNDPHLVYLDEVFHDRSPYENWTSKFDIGNIDIIKNLKYEKPIELDTLDEYFNTVAGFTNRNFFSKDTIFDEDYSSPTIITETLERYNDIKYRFGKGSLGHKLIQIEESVDLKNRKTTKNYILDDNNHLILSDYWSLLSKQAVLNGAGVVKLFFDEVEKERETEILKKKNRSWFEKIYDASAGKIFNTSKALYGSSVTYEDLQGAVIQSQKKPNPSPARTVLAEEEPKIFEEIEEIEETITEVEEVENTDQQNNIETNPTATDEENSVDIREDKLIPVITPFFGGGGGGVKTQEATEETPIPTPALPNSPTITSPSSSGSLFATSTITFSGTASSTLIISTDYSSATTTVDGNNEWELTLSDFSEGTTTIQFKATDSDNLDSDATEFSVSVDTTAPSVSSFSVLECDYSLRASACLSGSATVNLSWTSTSTDISYYSITQDGGSIATTTATSSSQTLTTGSTYSVAVVAYDEAGNVATSSAESVEISTMPIVINEVAWSGTASSSADEWIELYNRTAYTIDLSNISLASDDGVPYINLSGSIASDSYYLIERSDDNATSVSADLTTAFSGIGSGSGLSNTVEQLSLIQSLGGQASTTLDSTPTTSSCSSAWCAGTASSDYRSMERVDPDTAGTTTSNWSSNNTYTKNGTDIGGNAINGTPKSQNSVNLTPIGYYCPDETSTYISGGYYIPTSGSCTYLSPALSGGKYGDIYKGTVASSTSINGHAIGSNATSTQNNDDLTNPVQGEDYFVAIYKIRVNPIYNDVTDFRNYFKTGANAPPHLDYGVLEWKYGTAP